MPKPSKGETFYAVRNGRETGVFLSWRDCEAQVKGYPGAKYKSFANAADAEAFVAGTLPVGPASSNRDEASTSGTSDTKGKKRAMQEVLDEAKYDIVYSDGACKGNGKVGSVAGVGVWWGENDPRNIAERCPGDQTNNRAELIAIVRVLETTPKSKKPLLIKTDSQYSINCIHDWLPKWIKNNFRTAGGEPVKNADIIKYLATLQKARGLFGQVVDFKYVKGHSGDRGNDGADAQANLGTLLPSVPERDWVKEEREYMKQAEEERARNQDISKYLEKPPSVDIIFSPSTENPRKLRKVSHEAPFTSASTPESSSAPTPMKSILHTRSLAASKATPLVTSPSTPSRTAAVQTTPSKDIGSMTTPSITSRKQDIVQTATNRVAPPPPSSTELISPTNISSITPKKAPRSPITCTFYSPSRRHGAGLFTKTPPPDALNLKAMLPDLPSASARARAVELAANVKIQASKPPEAQTISGLSPGPMAMSVNTEDIDINDYLDCVADDDELLDDL